MVINIPVFWKFSALKHYLSRDHGPPIFTVEEDCNRVGLAEVWREPTPTGRWLIPLTSQANIGKTAPLLDTAIAHILAQPM